MNHERIMQLRKQRDELDAIVAHSLASMSAIDLAKAAQELIASPTLGIARCILRPDFTQGGAALMASAIIREALRKAETEEMDT